jgi:hypothetical protein
MKKREITTFQEFWPFYLKQHSKKATRTLHTLGLILALAQLGLSFYSRDWRNLITVPVLGYVFAWASHFGIEKNRPATWKYPYWSLISDFKMSFLVLAGKF